MKIGAHIVAAFERHLAEGRALLTATEGRDRLALGPALRWRFLVQSLLRNCFGVDHRSYVEFVNLASYGMLNRRRFGQVLDVFQAAVNLAKQGGVDAKLSLVCNLLDGALSGPAGEAGALDGGVDANHLRSQVAVAMGILAELMGAAPPAASRPSFAVVVERLTAKGILNTDQAEDLLAADVHRVERAAVLCRDALSSELNGGKEVTGSAVLSSRVGAQ